MRARAITPVKPSGSGETVLIEAVQEGSHPLDLRLVGCEGESPYVASSKIAVITGFVALLTRLQSSTAILGN